jgi:arsenite methyltransferase
MNNIYESEAFASMPEGSMHPGGLRLTDRAARLAGLSAGMTAADLGCGSGASAAYLASKYQLDMTGLDKSQELLDAGLSRYPGLKLVRWGGGALPFGDGTLDAVFIECFLSVIGDAEDILRQCARVLRKSGALIVSDVVIKRAAADSPLCTAQGFARQIQKAGFDVIVIEDHTDALRTFIAELRTRDGDCCGGALFGGRLTSLPRLPELGYTLFIARKT